MKKKKMIWGFAGPWYGEFLHKNGKYVSDPEKQLFVKLEFIAGNKLKCLGMSLHSIDKMSPELRERFGQYMEDNDLHTSLGIGYSFLETKESDIKKKNDSIISLLEKYKDLARARITTTGPGPSHRFDRTMPWEKKLQKFSKALKPLASACKKMGIPLGIENHGNYYCSDLVELCKNTRHLYIFLDTGNTYLHGERPLQAFEEAAPYTIGTQFKNHYVNPCFSPLRFEIQGAPLGQGDVHLKACYEILKKKAPDPDNLVMEMEMISPENMNPLDCLKKSLAFIRSL